MHGQRDLAFQDLGDIGSETVFLVDELALFHGPELEVCQFVTLLRMGEREVLLFQLQLGDPLLERGKVLAGLLQLGRVVPAQCLQLAAKC